MMNRPWMTLGFFLFAIVLVTAGSLRGPFPARANECTSTCVNDYTDCTTDCSNIIDPDEEEVCRESCGTTADSCGSDCEDAETLSTGTECTTTCISDYNDCSTDCANYIDPDEEDACREACGVTADTCDSDCEAAEATVSTTCAGIYTDCVSAAQTRNSSCRADCGSESCLILCDQAEEIDLETCTTAQAACEEAETLSTPGATPSPATTTTTTTPTARAPIPLYNPLAGGGGTDINKIIGNLVKAMLGLAGSLAFLMFVWGGFQWVTSAGDPEKVKKGKQTLIWAVTGLVLIFVGYYLVQAVVTVLTSGTT